MFIGYFGFFVLLQGALGFIGQVFFGGAWGMLHHLADLPSVAYLGVFAAGAGLAVWGEGDKKKREAGEAGGEGSGA